MMLEEDGMQLRQLVAHSNNKIFEEFFPLLLLSPRYGWRIPLLSKFRTIMTFMWAGQGGNLVDVPGKTPYP